ncbi:glycerol-3-phosphate 1-O-acyltransferase PlsY [Candidatus Bealeia paramacronuclearis]
MIDAFFDPITYIIMGGTYLMGSIPFGLIFTKFSGLGDIRSIGSGNIGTTNVLRTGNKKVAALTFFCDAAKGTLPVYITSIFKPELAPLAGFFAVFGHIFPVWLKFRGGKGVATAFGATLGLSWPLALMMLVTWITIAAITRYSSLAALVATVTSPFFAFVLTNLMTTYYALGLAVLLVFTHKNNIRRLVLGQESKIGDTTPLQNRGNDV